jgi:hypothetical protein
MLRFQLVGLWGRGEVACRWVESGYAPTEQVREAVERAWVEASSLPGVNLFDGPMCRLEAYGVAAGRLELSLSRTSYKQFMGTNMRNPQFADELGPEAMANPVGLSSALVSGDGVLLMGQRNDQVAYYPGMVHPFAGALEPNEPVDVFNEVQRELGEELLLGAADIAEMWCLGLVEDRLLRQPELVVLAAARPTRYRIETQLDGREHRGLWALEPDPAAAERALADTSKMTPVAVATLLLWGRERFGAGWFEQHRARFEQSDATR